MALSRWVELPGPNGTIAALAALDPWTLWLRPAEILDARLQALGLRPQRLRGFWTFDVPIAIIPQIRNADLSELVLRERPEWLSWLLSEGIRSEERARRAFRLAELSGADAVPPATDLYALQRTLEAIPQSSKLYEYQRLGVIWLHLAHGRAILGDDMGIGKTPQALVYLASEPTAKRALVVCPTSVAYHWQDQTKIWAPDWTFSVAKDARSLRRALESPVPERHGWVVTWALLRLTEEALLGTGFDTVVADEAHYAKEASAQRTRSLLRIAYRAERRVLLSGTAIRNRPRELWSLLHLCDPIRFPVFVPFGEAFCGARDQDAGFGRTRRVYNGVSQIESLNAILRSFSQRRTKIQVLPQLPPKTVRKYRIDPPDASFKKTYREILEALREEQKAGCGSNALGALQKLRKTVAFAKIDAAMEVVRPLVAEGEQVVLFLYHQAVREELERRFADEGIAFDCIVGETPKARRKGVCDRFRTGEIRVLIGSEACKEGVDFTSARHVVQLEYWWTPGDMGQAHDRVYRIGQTRGVLITVLHLNDSLDDHIDRLIQHKHDTIERVEDRGSIEAELLRALVEGN
jgi:SWI/SNF-related matrix-associated actin-dependent regulator 1 of chromatin subfamily A